MVRIDALLAPERAAGSAPLSHAVSSA
jgi:hypothetical protein